MPGSCNLMETFKMPVVYSVKDTIKGSLYYFIQPLNEKLDKLIQFNKSNSKVKSLTGKNAKSYR